MPSVDPSPESLRLGQIVILNGAPRSGKSSIAAAMQESFEGIWINLGNDVFIPAMPPRLRPGVGLRPGGERPDLERCLPALFAAMYESVAAHSRAGFNVVVDACHHEAYSSPLHILRDAARKLAGLPVLVVGVRCPLDVIMRRRASSQGAAATSYLTAGPDGSIPEPVQRWQREVHTPGIYDLELDTSLLSPSQCAAAIARRLASTEPQTAIAALADLPG